MPAEKWILIDGYNLLHASGVFGTGGRTSLESSREALLDWLGNVLSEAQRRRTTVIFDARYAPPGLPRSGEKHHIKIQFAPRGHEADDVLEELIDQHTAPRSLVVVSSDHRIHRAARRRRATPIDSDPWVAMVERRQRSKLNSQSDASVRDQQLDEDELQKWVDEFSD